MWTTTQWVGKPHKGIQQCHHVFRSKTSSSLTQSFPHQGRDSKAVLPMGSLWPCKVELLLLCCAFSAFSADCCMQRNHDTW